MVPAKTSVAALPPPNRVHPRSPLARQPKPALRPALCSPCTDRNYLHIVSPFQRARIRNQNVGQTCARRWSPSPCRAYNLHPMRFGKDDDADSSQVEDRRGSSAGGLAIGGGGLGIAGVVVYVLIRLLGGNVSVDDGSGG